MSTFGDVLRHFRERQALTQDVASGLVGVSRATFTQWETNKHLPSLQRGHDLDLALHADGDLVRALEEARARSPRAARSITTRSVEPQGLTLVQVAKRARRALLDQMCFEDGRAVGWRHNLVASDDPRSVLSTCYGLGALMRLGGPDAYTPEIVEQMLAIGVQPNGTITGWKARAQREPRLETTSQAISALLLVGARLPRDAIVDALRAQLDQVSRERPFAITLALEPLLRVAPDHEFTVELVSLLLERRWDFNGTLLWTEKRVGRRQPMVEPSVAHTARAVTVLRAASVELPAEAADAVDSATEWLAKQVSLDGVTEIVRRILPDGSTEELAFHHFTSALVVQALAGAEQPNHRAIDRATALVWERYSADFGLWAWGNGDVPAWLLADAISALQSAANAALTAPDPS